MQILKGGIFVFHYQRFIKSILHGLHSPVSYFLLNSSAWKNHFDFVWPLRTCFFLVFLFLSFSFSLCWEASTSTTTFFVSPAYKHKLVFRALIAKRSDEITALIIQPPTTTNIQPKEVQIVFRLLPTARTYLGYFFSQLPMWDVDWLIEMPWTGLTVHSDD